MPRMVRQARQLGERSGAKTPPPLQITPSLSAVVWFPESKTAA